MTGQTPFLYTSIEFLKGVGPERAKLLRQELHIRTYGDLLQHFPFRYEDRTQFVTVADVRSDETEVQLRGRIMSVQTVGIKGKGQRLVAQFSDGTGTLELVWFKGIQWVLPKLVIGKEYVIYGKPSKFKSSFNIVHPELETAEVHRSKLSTAMVPVYPSTVKATEKGLDSKGISRVLQLLVGQLNGQMPETLSTPFRQQYGLMGREQAFVNVHFPKGANELRHAIFRLKFDELFFIQLKLLKLKLINQKKFRGAVFAEVGEMVNRFYKECLPFELTGAQKRVIKEIRRDLGSGSQMSRLVQGDVGSGKTIVALMSMLLAIDNGFQAALMAPTEILAEQHFRNISTMVEPLGINVRLLTGSTKTAQRNIIHDELRSGALHILIGTHALIEDAVQFKQLGLEIGRAHV
jgi:ATP-dependent DNA helicase RecG